MTICNTPDCPAASPTDEFGRRTAVQHAGLAQSRLDATGQHLLNRGLDGSLAAHVGSWSDRELDRAVAGMAEEFERAGRYSCAVADALTVLARARTTSTGGEA